MNLRIGIVLSKTPSYSETFFLNKIKGLLKSGLVVTLYVQKTNPDFTLCPVIVAPNVNKNNSVIQFFKMTFVLCRFLMRFPKRFFDFIRLERQAQRSSFQMAKNMYNNMHLLQANVDWLHFGFATIAIQSENVSRAIQAKMGVSFRGFDIDVYPKNHPNCYNLLWKQVDKVHTISEYLLKEAYKLGLSTKTAYKIITPAIDVVQFHREEYLFSKDRIQIISVARLHPIKDLKFSIDAMAILKKQEPDFQYHIIGDGPEAEELQEQIIRLELHNHVKLLGRKEPNEVLDALKQSDIYVQYSASEGFCNAVLEAQSVGLLCVVSNGGALPENVLHEKTGWVVPKKKPHLLAQAIRNIIHLPDADKKQISLVAQERVKLLFNLNKQQKLFIAFYESN